MKALTQSTVILAPPLQKIYVVPILGPAVNIYIFINLKESP